MNKEYYCRFLPYFPYQRRRWDSGVIVSPKSMLDGNLVWEPGSPKQFVYEERIFKGPASAAARMATSAPTQRTVRHDKPVEKRAKGIWIPHRCELCNRHNEDGGSELLRCSRCQLVFNCCKEHQVEDFERHKVECKMLSKLDVKPKPFSDPKSLEKYPIGCHPFAQDAFDKEKCQVCGAKNAEATLGYTPCFNILMCDNDHEILTR